MEHRTCIINSFNAEVYHCSNPSSLTQHPKPFYVFLCSYALHGLIQWNVVWDPRFAPMYAGWLWQCVQCIQCVRCMRCMHVSNVCDVCDVCMYQMCIRCMRVADVFDVSDVCGSSVAHHLSLGRSQTQDTQPVHTFTSSKLSTSSLKILVLIIIGLVWFNTQGQSEYQTQDMQPCNAVDTTASVLILLYHAYFHISESSTSSAVT